MVAKKTSSPIVEGKAYFQYRSSKFDNGLFLGVRKFPGDFSIVRSGPLRVHSTFLVPPMVLIFLRGSTTTSSSIE